MQGIRLASSMFTRGLPDRNATGAPNPYNISGGAQIVFLPSDPGTAHTNSFPGLFNSVQGAQSFNEQPGVYSNGTQHTSNASSVAQIGTQATQTAGQPRPGGPTIGISVDLPASSRNNARGPLSNRLRPNDPEAEKKYVEVQITFQLVACVLVENASTADGISMIFLRTS